MDPLQPLQDFASKWAPTETKHIPFSRHVLQVEIVAFLDHVPWPFICLPDGAASALGVAVRDD